MIKKPYQGKTTDEDHGYHSRFKVFVFNQPESLDAKIAPALPKWRVWITGNAWKFEVTAFGTTVGRVVVHHQLLRGGLQYLSLHSKKTSKKYLINYLCWKVIHETLKMHKMQFKAQCYKQWVYKAPLCITLRIRTWVVAYLILIHNHLKKKTKLFSPSFYASF